MDIQATIELYPRGTTFCIAAGVRRINTAIVPKSNDVLVGEAGAVLNGSKRLTSFSRDGNYWVATGQTQQGPVSDLDCLPATYTGCRYPEGVFYDDLSLKQETGLSQLNAGEFYFDYAADKIYLLDDPSGHKVEASYVPEAIRGFSTYQTNVTIRGLLVEKFANWPTDKTAAITTGDGWLLEDNEVRLNDGVGIQAGTGSVVRDNVVHDNGRLGIATAFAHGVLIEGNEIAANDANDYSFSNAGATKIWDSSNVTLRNNFVHDNQGHGLRTDTDCIGIVFEGNTVVRNTGIGIFHEISYDAVIRNNTVKGNNTSRAGSTPWYGGQIVDYDSPNVEIYGNVVEAGSGTHGIILRDDDRGFGAFGKREIRNVSVHDNIVTAPAGSMTGLAGNRSLDVYSGLGIRFEDNSYEVASSKGTFWFWGTGLSAPRTWDAWQADGQDAAGQTRVV
jgi:parallel beta-helix repeat protein